MISQHNGECLDSDHLSVSFYVNIGSGYVNCTKSKTVFNYKKADWKGLCNLLMDCDFSCCFKFKDVEEIWLEFKQIISSAMDIYIPKVKLKTHQHPKWSTPQHRHFSNCVRTLRKMHSKKPSPASQYNLIREKNRLKDELKWAKEKFETNLFCKFAQEIDSSHLFKYISYLREGGAIPSTVCFGSVSASNNLDKATLFNKYFHSVFTTSSFTLPPPDLMPVSDPNCSELTISEEDVFNILSSLDQSKAMGLDGIGPRILKSCALSIYQPLHYLFTISLQTHKIPKEWKIHCITPIHKSGDRSSVTNYRPISLLSTTSKVLELLIKKKCYTYLESSLSAAQFGFRYGHSTLQQLLLFYTHVFDLNTPCSHYDVIFLDFARAFDSVPHQELLLKLRMLGVSGKLWLWLQEYLSGRMQCVSIEDTKSDLLPVISGVPQGSILGPLLFLAYTNDMPDVISHSDLLLFADDAKCLKMIECEDDSKLLQEDLDSLCMWSTQWKLKFKTAKCALMSLKSKPENQSEYIINDNKITAVTMYRDLGVTISSDQSWSQHINPLTSIVQKSILPLRDRNRAYMHGFQRIRSNVLLINIKC